MSDVAGIGGTGIGGTAEILKGYARLLVGVASVMGVQHRGRRRRSGVGGTIMVTRLGHGWADNVSSRARGLPVLYRTFSISRESRESTADLALATS